MKKTSDQGQNVSQTVEIKQNKFVFEILGAGDQLFLHAEGDFKLEKLGPFSSVRFLNIRGGASAADLQDVSEEYVSIYTLDTDTWTLASNFDRDREQKPSLDLYQRVKPAEMTRTLVIDEIQMAETPQGGKWYVCFEASVETVRAKYHVESKGYDTGKLSIPMALELAKVKLGQKCSFKLQSDDVDGDECTDEADNRSAGEFSISESGSQEFKPEAGWRYTLRWHLK